MGKIKVVLWDIDETLLNFTNSQKAALKKGFKEFNLGPCNDEIIAKYSKINIGYWKKLEKGLMKREEVLVGRFKEFFENMGIDTSIVKEFNERYQENLPDITEENDNSVEIVRNLKPFVNQYIVTNGTAKAQNKKLDKSGLKRLVDGIFISEEVGYEKPTIEFFNEVFKNIRNVKKEEIIIIGDSLTSDMKGGNNAGILNCWYNPKNKVNKYKIKIDYEIKHLGEIYKILGINN